MEQIRTFLGKESWKTIRFAVTSLVIIAAINFDGFWHVSIGRDSLFILPHLILYSALIFLFMFMYDSRGTIPRISLLLAFLVVASGPFDNWWHNNFGIEELNNIMIVWSPPHLMAELSILGLLIIVMQTLVNQNAKFSLTLQWAAISSLVLFMVMPLGLLSPYDVLGPFGGLISLFVIGLLINGYLQLGRKHLWPLLTVMFLLSLPLYIQEGPITDFENFHEHLPLFALAILVLAPAVIVDIFGAAKSNLFKTTLFLLAYVAIYLGGHMLLVEGYSKLWYALPVYGILTYFIALSSYKIIKRTYNYTGKKIPFTTWL